MVAAKTRDGLQESNDQFLEVWTNFIDCIEKENHSIVFEKLPEKLELERFKPEKFFGEKVGS